MLENPPLRGPSPPPASEIVMTSRPTSARLLSRPFGAIRTTAASTPCAAIDRVIMRWKPRGSRIRSRRMSVTSMNASSLIGQLGDEPDVGHARRLQAIEDFHQILIEHAAVAAQVHLLVRER